MLKIVIISDYSVIRIGIRAAVAPLSPDDIVESPASPSAVAALLLSETDAALETVVALIDVTMTPLDTSASICQVLRSAPNTKGLIGVDALGSRTHAVIHLVEAGLTGFVSVTGDATPLMNAIAASVRGESVIQVPSGSALGIDRGPLVDIVRSPKVEQQDIEILRLMGRGLKDRGVAEMLGFCESTVKHPVLALEQRFTISTRFQLGAWANEHALTVPQLECDER
jgi:DNA-binding NarL/FixJ family response regulator